MIRISTKGRYGIRLMLNLALHYDKSDSHTMLKTISKEEDISIRYLEQIIIPLRNKGLVKSTRGAGGGYKLTRHPSDIKLKEIIETMEGPICLVDCMIESTYCNRIPNCTTYEIWKEASIMMQKYFDKITLQDLVNISDRKKLRHI